MALYSACGSVNKSASLRNMLVAASENFRIDSLYGCEAISRSFLTFLEATMRHNGPFILV